MTIEDIDARSLALHRQVAQKIRAAPELFQLATGNLARWKRRGVTDPLVDEWQRILDTGLDAALTAATDDSDRGALLRRSSPFPGVLTATERTAILTAWRIVHEAR
jgi:hypothetical protein